MSYKTIPQLITEISNKANKLENGNLSLLELDEMLNFSREINERIAILRYQSINKKNRTTESEKENSQTKTNLTKEDILNEISTKTIKTDSNDGFSLNFNIKEEEVIEKTTQRNLIDQIAEDKPLNTQLSSNKKTSIGEQLKRSKIEDLRKVIGLNQKFLFMNDLFEGEKSHYDEAIDKINLMESPQKVIDFLTNDLAIRFKWDNNSNSVKEFNELVNRKFA